MPSKALLIPEKSGRIPVLSQSLVEQAHARNKSVLVWTINDSQDFTRLYLIGVDGFITDYPENLQNWYRTHHTPILE